MEKIEKVLGASLWPGLKALGRPFLKMHGLRNHFVIVDGRHQVFTPSLQDITKICSVKEGVGAEQLLILEPPSKAGAAKGAVAFIRILNIDGREVGACGNATRCAAHLLLEELNTETIILETKAGPLECNRAGALRVSVNMGAVSLDWRKMPLKLRKSIGL